MTLPATPPSHANFWQTRLGQHVLPFAASLGLHCAVVLIGVVTVRVVQMAGAKVEPQAVPAQMEVTSREWLERVTLDTQRGAGEELFERTMQDEVAEVPPDAIGWNR